MYFNIIAQPRVRLSRGLGFSASWRGGRENLSHVRPGSSRELEYTIELHFYNYGYEIFISYVSGSSKIQTLSFDSSSIKTEIYSDGNTHRLLNLHLGMCRYKTN